MNTNLHNCLQVARDAAAEAGDDFCVKVLSGLLEDDHKAIYDAVSIHVGKVSTELYESIRSLSDSQVQEFAHRMTRRAIEQMKVPTDLQIAQARLSLMSDEELESRANRLFDSIQNQQEQPDE